MDRIDFRSDTVSWPTPKMRTAMAEAIVGDDVYGEDPTVNALEALAAAKLGKEAGLFVASGTMGNLVGLLTHAGRGDEVIIGQDNHVMMWEAGSVAALGGIFPHVLPTDQYGRLDLESVAAAVRSDDPHLPRTRVIHVENSYGNKCGYPISVDYFAEIRAVADEYNLAVHMDGARLFNAAVALGVDASAITEHVDSVTFCLSKGLCAPVGSIICGSADFIHAARRTRKALGGGMRQAGILAAAGIVALNEMIERMAIDHDHARLLAAGLSNIPGVKLDIDMVKTNMVFFSLTDEITLPAREITTRLQAENIWIGANGPRKFRVVTHYWIDHDHVTKFLATLRSILAT